MKNLIVTWVLFFFPTAQSLAQTVVNSSTKTAVMTNNLNVGNVVIKSSTSTGGNNVLQIQNQSGTLVFGVRQDGVLTGNGTSLSGIGGVTGNNIWTGTNSFTNAAGVTVTSTVTANKGMFNATGGDYSIATASGILVNAGGIVAPSFSGTHYGNGQSLILNSSTVTLKGNATNSANALVMLDGSSRYPALDGSQITNVSIPSTITVVATPGAIISTYTLGYFVNQGTFDGNNAWFTTQTNGTIIKVSTTGTVTTFTYAGWTEARAIGYNVATGNIYVVMYASGSINVITSSGGWTNSFATPAGTSGFLGTIAFDSYGNAWVGGSNNFIEKVSSGNFVQEFSNGYVSKGTTCHDGKYLWLMSSVGDIVRVSSTGVVTAYPSIYNESQGGTACDGQYIWGLGRDPNNGYKTMLTRFDPVTLSSTVITGLSTVNTAADSIYYDGYGGIWIANRVGGTITQLSQDNTVTATYTLPVNIYPRAMVYDGVNWVIGGENDTRGYRFSGTAKSGRGVANTTQTSVNSANAIGAKVKNYVPAGFALCISGDFIGHCTTTPTNGACTCTVP